MLRVIRHNRPGSPSLVWLKQNRAIPQMLAMTTRTSVTAMSDSQWPAIAVARRARDTLNIKERFMGAWPGRRCKFKLASSCSGVVLSGWSCWHSVSRYDYFHGSHEHCSLFLLGDWVLKAGLGGYPKAQPRFLCDSLVPADFKSPRRNRFSNPSILTVLISMSYYNQLQQFNNANKITTTSFLVVCKPASLRGIIAPTIVASVHLLLVAYVIYQFLFNSSISTIGNAWQTATQVVQGESKRLNDSARLATDDKIEEMVKLNGGSVNLLVLGSLRTGLILSSLIQTPGGSS